MKKIPAITIAFGIMLFLVGCKDLGKVKIEDLTEGKPSTPSTPSNPETPIAGVDASVVFAGISSVTNKSDSGVTLNWSIHARAVAYDVFNITNGEMNYLTTLVGRNVTSTHLTGLTPSESYHFRVRLRTSAGLYDGNENDVAVAMNANPSTPSTIAFISPYSSPGLSTTPLVRVSGVKIGDTVKLYSDSSCSTEIGSQSVTEGTTVEIRTTTLALGNSYTIYTRAIGQSANPSSCSSANLAYVLNSCPVGYIPVERNLAVGTTNDFCVAKYEMKNVGGVATSQADLTPWTNINQHDALVRCSELNTVHGVVNKFTLISNPEWMTVARNIEQVDENWASMYGSPAQKGVGILARGHSDNMPMNTIAASTNDLQGYYGTSSDPSDDGYYWAWSQKRTLKLSNNFTIWDFSGNAMEWVDWKVVLSKKAMYSNYGYGTNWIEWRQLDTNIGENSDDVFLPETWASSFIYFDAGRPDLVTSLGSDNGIGSYVSNTELIGEGAARGSSYYGGTSAGIFSLNFIGSSSGYGEVGFRCVYRP